MKTGVPNRKDTRKDTRNQNRKDTRNQLVGIQLSNNS